MISSGVNLSSVLSRSYPFLFVDKIIDAAPGQFCHAYKNISFNEYFFPVHFPNNPIFPGSLQIEAFTQVAALALMDVDLSSDEAHGLGENYLLASVDKTRFYQSVTPGDRFEILAEVKKNNLGIAIIGVVGSVNDTKVSECTLTYKIMEN